MTGKASIICINKWDTVETEDKNTVEYDKKVYTALSYMMYAPTLYVSAKTGQRVTKLFEMITGVPRKPKTSRNWFSIYL